MYPNSFISGFGTGFASLVNPLYVAEVAPRAIRGGLIGAYQLFIVAGIFLAYWINYGCIQHIEGTTSKPPTPLSSIPTASISTGTMVERCLWCHIRPHRPPVLPF